MRNSTHLVQQLEEARSQWDRDAENDALREEERFRYIY